MECGKHAPMPDQLGTGTRSPCPHASPMQRQVRTLFKTEHTVLMSDSELRGKRQFLVGLQLPAPLPPSFRGSAARFSYSVDVQVVYHQKSQGEL